MFINLKKMNINVVIGILLILVIIYIVYNKKQEVFTGNYPNLSDVLQKKLEELVTSCFDEQQQPLLVSEILDKDMLTNPIIKEEIKLAHKLESWSALNVLIPMIMVIIPPRSLSSVVTPFVPFV